MFSSIFVPLECRIPLKAGIINSAAIRSLLQIIMGGMNCPDALQQQTTYSCVYSSFSTCKSCNLFFFLFAATTFWHLFRTVENSLPSTLNMGVPSHLFSSHIFSDKSKNVDTLSLLNPLAKEVQSGVLNERSWCLLIKL